MRGGKPIVYLAFGFLIAWVFQPAWEWAVGRFLDSAAKAHGGIVSAVTKALAATAPVHGFLLGISVGMLLALTIGYWGQIKGRVRYWFEWCRAVLWLWAQTMRRRKIAQGMFILPQNERSKEVSLEDAPVKVWDTEVRWWPQAPLVCHLSTPTQLLAIRHRATDIKDEIPITYEVWGRRDFWKTITAWRKSDQIARILAYRDDERARAMAEKSATVEIPKSDLPEFEP